MARTYRRDARGRFAGGGGGSGGRSSRPATKRVQRGTNRLTRDNAGRIQGVGGSGATARGGRLRTASGNQRATQLDRLKGRIGGTVSQGGKAKARPGGTVSASGARIRAGRPTRSKMTSIENRLSRVGLAGKRREYKYRAAGADLRLDATKLEKARKTDKRARAYRRKILASAR